MFAQRKPSADSTPEQQDLATENARLQRQLAAFIKQAQSNEEIMRRHQLLDIEFISAGGFRELINRIFQFLPVSSDLDVVTLTLLDPDYSIRRILADLQVDLSAFPLLVFVDDESYFGPLRSRMHRPVLGSYSKALHGSVFPAPAPTPASVAIMPLWRQERLLGSLNLGSFAPARFTATMGTDFIEHRASIAAICLENVLNHERLKHIGLTDPLTGVNNRRYIERRLLEEIGRSRRQHYALSCMYIDIDHFKQINDRIGHQAGDEVLREIAARIKAELRLSDALGRFGGEEFVVLLIDASLDAATQVAQRIRASIADRPLRLSSGETLQVSASIGVATLTASHESQPIEEVAQQFIARADHALYEAKRSGRNRVVEAY